MKKVKGQPITGAQPEYSQKKPAIVPDAKETSADEQRFIDEAPSPFKNKFQTGNMNTSTGPSGGISTLEPKISSGLKHSNPGSKALPSGGPVGQSKLPNQSKQIGGRMGFPPPARKAGAYPSGYKAKKGAAFYGE